MPVPSSIADLSTTPASNSPAGSESPTTADDYLRTYAAFIKQVDDASVKTAGAQTIAGVKTFNSSPLVPTPTTGSQAVNKDYADNAGFPTGTAMIFVQTAAPIGWTKSTTHNDKALRVVSGTASSGGTSAFTTVFANQTPTITTSGLSAGATTLSTAQMPSHTHSHSVSATSSGGPGGASADTAGFTQTGAAGGGDSHSHSISGSATSSAITLAVQYVDVIIATKS